MHTTWQCSHLIKTTHTIFGLNLLSSLKHDMDPISIATTAAGVVGVCGKVLEYVYMYAKSCQDVDHNVEVLAIEVEQLKGVLSSLATSFDPSLALESQTGYEGEHWRNV